MRIATFGSCLSRYTANNFTYLFGGKVVSSVYHNRSDIFLGRFIDGTIDDLEMSEINDLLKTVDGKVPADSSANRILENQTREGHGRHRLSKGITFLDVLDTKAADIVIFDNYMDISAKMLEIDGTQEGSKWFLRPNDLKDPTSCRPADLLDPEVGAEAMVKIIDHTRKMLPDAHIVYCNFPHNTYEKTPERVRRTIAYEKAISKVKDRSFSFIPSLAVPTKFQTHERQHYKPEMYCAYAGAIWALRDG